MFDPLPELELVDLEKRTFRQATTCESARTSGSEPRSAVGAPQPMGLPKRITFPSGSVM